MFVQNGAGLNWSDVREYYEFGHTRAECQECFGFSNGAWQRAVDRGEIAPRPRSSGLRAGEKRKAIARLRGLGASYVAIAKELNLSKSTVAYHARRLGLPADERFSRRYDWSIVQAAVDTGLSRRQCMKRFGFSSDAWAKAVKRGDIVPNQWVTPIEELLVAGRPRSRGHLKLRLLGPGSRRTDASGAASPSGAESR